MPYFPLFPGKDAKFGNTKALPCVETVVNGKITEQKDQPLFKKSHDVFEERFWWNAVIELLSWADSIILYIFIFYNATEGDNTEYYDVEGAGLRRTTNISVCNVLPWILKPMNV